MSDINLSKRLLLESQRAQAWFEVGDEKEYERCHCSINYLLDLFDKIKTSS